MRRFIFLFAVGFTVAVMAQGANAEAKKSPGGGGSNTVQSKPAPAKTPIKSEDIKIPIKPPPKAGESTVGNAGVSGATTKGGPSGPSGPGPGGSGGGPHPE